MKALEKNISRRKKSSTTPSEPSEVWANSIYLNEFCFVKIPLYPWWPARKCQPKDDALKSNLELSSRLLVSLVGERGGLRVVKTENLVPFSETIPGEEDLSDQTRDIRNQLDEAMAIARRVVRGKNKKQKAKKPPLSALN